MEVTLLPILDAPGPDSLRGYIERNLIAILSNSAGGNVLSPIDPPGNDWLGRLSSRPEISRSGLWNVRHVGEAWEPGFLDQFEKMILEG
jgi:hypothetical protein